MIGIAILCITLIAILSLSISINKNYENTYKDIASKSFFHKSRALQAEFLQIDEHLQTLTHLVQTTPIAQLHTKYSVLNEVYKHGEMVKYNWYIVIDSTNKVVDSNFDGQLNMKLNSPIIQEIIYHKNNQARNNFITINNQMYWLLWQDILLPNNQRAITGFSFDLKALHAHLTTTDVTTPNYAYIFAQDGTCIYHPELSLIGTNVFKQSSLSTPDTLQATPLQDPPIILSEYLQMEVFRFIAPFETKSFKGFISVNFPKINVDESLSPLKRNTYLIFTTTIFVILLLFYFFTIENKRTYKEKELLAVEKEKVNKEKALMQLKQLKNQINPHFLFNSLNSLYMLIGMDKVQAQKFTLDLSKTYRYLITSPTEDIVELNQELTFIKQYIDLQQIRFSKELHFEIADKRTNSDTKKIPYLALQITIENALKHNVATTENPLLVQVVIADNAIIVTNNYQPKRREEEGEKFGLTYLSSIYNYYNKTEYKATVEGEVFVCVLPLFNC
jgi:hypothetical protein